MGNGEVGGKLPELANIAEEMPFELKVRLTAAMFPACRRVIDAAVGLTWHT